MKAFNYARTTLALTIAGLAFGCVSTPTIDPAELPPEALVDDGVDYYSNTSSAADEISNYSANQWTTDDDGNKIHHINRVPRGRSSQYYVGDARYLQTNPAASGGQGGYINSPANVSRPGWSLHNDSFRGSNDNVYQTRRGRIIYLPTRARQPQPSTDQSANDSGTAPATSNSTTSGATTSTPATSRPSPSSRSTTRSRPARSSGSRSTRTTRRTEQPRRVDR